MATRKRKARPRKQVGDRSSLPTASDLNIESFLVSPDEALIDFDFSEQFVGQFGDRFEFGTFTNPGNISTRQPEKEILFGDLPTPTGPPGPPPTATELGGREGGPVSQDRGPLTQIELAIARRQTKDIELTNLLTQAFKARDRGDFTSDKTFQSQAVIRASSIDAEVRQELKTFQEGGGLLAAQDEFLDSLSPEKPALSASTFQGSGPSFSSQGIKPIPLVRPDAPEITISTSGISPLREKKKRKPRF